jgi:GT2 family glycosyltransferase
MPVLSVILVNYKRTQDTIDCVRSLEQSTFLDFDIIIVDNGAGEGSRRAFTEGCPHAILLFSERNLGFAEGNNVGIREALRRGSTYILLLNNDTIIDKQALAEMVKSLSHDRSIGIVGAKIYYFDRPNVLWFAGAYLNVNAARYGHYGIGEKDSGQYDGERRTDYVTGCCLMFRREVADQIGLLDKAYFAYLEDADFCLRARAAGFAVSYQPKAIIYHKVSSASAWDSPVYIYFNLRNKLLFLRRHSNSFRWLPFLPGLVYFYARQFIRLVFKWRDAQKVQAAWYGMVDGLRDYTGEIGEGRMPLIGSAKRKR